MDTQPLPRLGDRDSGPSSLWSRMHSVTENGAPNFRRPWSQARPTPGRRQAPVIRTLIAKTRVSSASPSRHRHLGLRHVWRLAPHTPRQMPQQAFHALVALRRTWPTPIGANRLAGVTADSGRVESEKHRELHDLFHCEKQTK